MVVEQLNARQTQGATLLLTALGLLVFPGVIINNLQASGIIGASVSPTCPAGETVQGQFCVSADGNTVVLNNQNPCTLNVNNCNLSGASFQVLNPCSTWVNLLTLNFGGFVSSFFTNCGQSSGQNLGPGGGSATQVQTTGSFTFTTCALGGSFYNNQTGRGQATYWCNSASPSIVTPNGTMGVAALAPSGTGQWNLQMNIGFGALGYCIASNWNGVITNATLSSTSTAASACIQGYLLPSGCTPATCPISAIPSTSPLYNTCVSGVQAGTPSHCLTFYTLNSQCTVSGTYYSPSDARNRIKTFSCTNLITQNSFVLPGLTDTSIGQAFLSGFNVSNILSFALGLFGAILVVWLSLGLGFSWTAATVGSSFSSNPQGTKIAQTFGIGLLLWFPLYSAFDTWFTRGYLPVFNTSNGIQTGLDGNILVGQVGIVSLILTVMFFLGLYFMSQTPGAASS